MNDMRILLALLLVLRSLVARQPDCFCRVVSYGQQAILRYGRSLEMR
jgi:hypothetical protein